MDKLPTPHRSHWNEWILAIINISLDIVGLKSKIYNLEITDMNYFLLACSALFSLIPIFSLTLINFLPLFSSFSCSYLPTLFLGCTAVYCGGGGCTAVYAFWYNLILKESCFVFRCYVLLCVFVNISAVTVCTILQSRIQ